MWESNPPKQLFATITGFEDQRAHQHPSTPIKRESLYHTFTKDATFRLCSARFVEKSGGLLFPLPRVFENDRYDWSMERVWRARF